MKNTRRILTAGAAAAVVLLSTGGTAMAKTCDPAPNPYNVQQQTKGNGDVIVWIAYGWDGTSVWPVCQGPLVGARTQNTSLTTTWYVHLQGLKGQPVTVAIPPASTRTYSAAQLASVGLTTVDDISGLTLTTTP